jgi:hypothetical protein
MLKRIGKQDVNLHLDLGKAGNKFISNVTWSAIKDAEQYLCQFLK